MRCWSMLLFVSGCAATEAPELGRAGELRSGLLLTDPEHPAVIQFEVIDDEWLLEGDILLSADQIQPIDADTEVIQQPIAAVEKEYRWPKGIVPYAIDPNLPAKQRVKDAILHWEKHTNVRFVAHTDQPDYVFFTQGKGCVAELGRTGGRQWVKLAPFCGTGEVVHEIGHSVGLWHEQSRADRNQHVEVRWKNIEAGMAYNFQTYVQQGFGGVDLGAYDYGSIMHYDSYSFSRNGKPTLVKKGGGIIHANRDVLSAKDILAVAKLYPKE